ncbi:MAG: DNA topoisomerase I [Candidatus Micrarchaeia archaeon]
MAVLVITEKPRVAERMASALAQGPIQRKSLGGLSYYVCRRGGQEIVIAPAVGHVYALRQVAKGSGYPVFDIEWAPAFEVEKKAAYTKRYIALLSSLAKKADSFVVACDYDIEGSLIGFNVLRFACGTQQGSRMKFSALTPDDLVAAWEGRGPLDYQNAWAGEARHILDWLWGINLSRALMHAMRSAGVFKVLSIGRVQGPALAILAAREREIAAFKPTPYWEVSAVIKDVRFLHERGRFMSLEEAEGALERSDRSGAITSISKKEFSVPPEPPFDLTSLQLAAYSAFGFAPAQTLELAQSLYEASLISYPRTSSQKLPPKLNLQKIMGELAKQPAYSRLAASLIQQKRFVPREGKKSDPAHPAIYPTGLAPGKLAEREARLYDLIVKRFLACFAEPAVRESQRITARLGSECFNAAGTRTVQEGWLAFYAPYAKLEEASLPEFKEGEAVQAEGVSLQEKATQPPRRFTPASIIEVLERRNLGTKATRAGIIETLYARGYTEEKNIRVTPFGLAVADALAKNCPEILDEKLTRGLEEKMSAIQEGKASGEEVIAEGKSLLRHILVEFKAREADIGRELFAALKQTEEQQSLLGPCLACRAGSLRVLRSRAGKMFVGCSRYPACRNAYPLPQGARIKPLGRACEHCGTPLIRVFRKGRRPFEMCLLPTCESKQGWGKKSE